MLKKWLLTSLTFFMFISAEPIIGSIPTSVRSEQAINRVQSTLEADLKAKGLNFGAPIFIRIFKKPAVLELWVDNGTEFRLFKSYPICTFSGGLGPKRKEGDRKSPEGFYFVKPKQLNPWSRFHLSFNIGYPNAYDRWHGYTGSALMVHGNCVSIGCYAMTDSYIEEIYALADAAFRQGQSFFRVHIFPFPLTDENFAKYKRRSRWTDFWENLRPGYDYFEQHKKPPNIIVKSGLYVISN